MSSFIDLFSSHAHAIRAPLLSLYFLCGIVLYLYQEGRERIGFSLPGPVEVALLLLFWCSGLLFFPALMLPEIVMISDALLTALLSLVALAGTVAMFLLPCLAHWIEAHGWLQPRKQDHRSLERITSVFD